jgi:TonB family protein
MGERRGPALVGGVLLALLVGGGGSYLYFARPAPVTDNRSEAGLSPEAQAALARVRQLEKALTELKREKAALEAAMKASATPSEAGTEPPRDERQTIPAVAANPRRDVPTPDTRAQDEARARTEARRRARAEKARREEQIRLLEEEIQVAQTRLVTEQESVAAAFDPSAALEATTTPLPTPEPPPPPPTTQPSVRPGQLVDPDDPGFSGPVLEDEGPPVIYPAAAKILRRGALVVVEALVGEDGRVLETTILECSVTGLGFEEVAERSVRARRYRPATRDGVPVRVWVQVRVRFTP